MVMRSQRGFTLIETIIVLAISAMLVVIALRGFSASRAAAEFTQAVDAAKESVSLMRAASNASVNDVGAGTGAVNACTVTLGEVATFVPNASTASIKRIRSLNTEIASCGGGTDPALDTTQAADPASMNFKWGLVYTGYTIGGVTTNATYNLAYTHSITDGRWMATGFPGALPTTYSQVDGGTGQVDLNFVSKEGKHAYVRIELDNGGITRGFQ